jgi:uncharacterized protein YodC (DUF2158 family)
MFSAIFKLPKIKLFTSKQSNIFMANSEITVGSIVMLKSGGPAMTVSKISNNWADCIWFPKNSQTDYGSDTKETSFTLNVLKVVVLPENEK